jgi:hypothetical protein
MDTPPGTKAGSSRHFGVTALLIPDGTQNEIIRQWQEAGERTGRPPGTTLLWKKVKSPSQRRHLLEVMTGLPDAMLISVVLCKWHLLERGTKLTDPEYLYHWPLRLLLERISWLGQRKNVRVATHLSQVSGVPPGVIRRYIRRLGRLETYISWEHLILPPGVSTPQKQVMLQLADFGSAAIYRAFEKDEFGYANQSYIEMLKPKIWRRPGRALWEDGLKYGPWSRSAQPCREEHPWFEDFCR